MKSYGLPCFIQHIVMQTTKVVFFNLIIVDASLRVVSRGATKSKTICNQLNMARMSEWFMPEASHFICGTDLTGRLINTLTSSDRTMVFWYILSVYLGVWRHMKHETTWTTLLCLSVLLFRKTTPISAYLQIIKDIWYYLSDISRNAVMSDRSGMLDLFVSQFLNMSKWNPIIYPTAYNKYQQISI